MDPPITAIAMEWGFLREAPACPMFDKFVSHLIDSGYVPVGFIHPRDFCRMPTDMNDPRWDHAFDVIWVKSNKLTSKMNRRFGLGTISGWLSSC